MKVDMKEGRRVRVRIYPTERGWGFVRYRKFSGGKYASLEYRRYFYGDDAEARARAYMDAWGMG